MKWSPSEGAYIVSEADAIDTLKLIESQAAEIAALRNILDEQNAQIDRVQVAYNSLSDARAFERDAWQKQVSQLESELRRQKRKKIAFGPFVGYDTHGEWGAGIGVTYKVFEL